MGQAKYFSPSEELKIEKKKARKIAKEMCYPEEVRDRITRARSITEISNILFDARNMSD